MQCKSFSVQRHSLEVIRNNTKSPDLKSIRWQFDKQKKTFQKWTPITTTFLTFRRAPIRRTFRKRKSHYCINFLRLTPNATSTCGGSYKIYATQSHPQNPAEDVAHLPGLSKSQVWLLVNEAYDVLSNLIFFRSDNLNIHVLHYRRQSGNERHIWPLWRRGSKVWYHIQPTVCVPRWSDENLQVNALILLSPSFIVALSLSLILSHSVTFSHFRALSTKMPTWTSYCLWTSRKCTTERLKLYKFCVAITLPVGTEVYYKSIDWLSRYSRALHRERNICFERRVTRDRTPYQPMLSSVLKMWKMMSIAEKEPIYTWIIPFSS